MNQQSLHSFSEVFHLFNIKDFSPLPYCMKLCLLNFGEFKKDFTILFVCDRDKFEKQFCLHKSVLCKIHLKSDDALGDIYAYFF